MLLGWHVVSLGLLIVVVVVAVVAIVFLNNHIDCTFLLFVEFLCAGRIIFAVNIATVSFTGVRLNKLSNPFANLFRDLVALTPATLMNIATSMIW